MNIMVKMYTYAWDKISHVQFNRWSDSIKNSIIIRDDNVAEISNITHSY